MNNIRESADKMVAVISLNTTHLIRLIQLGLFRLNLATFATYYHDSVVIEKVSILVITRNTPWAGTETCPYNWYHSALISVSPLGELKMPLVY